jgi:hypothetical protein
VLPELAVESQAKRDGTRTAARRQVIRSPIEWDNVLLYRQYVIDPSLIRTS